MQVRKVGFYLRVSTERQAREAEGSLKSQKQRLELEVQRRNEHSPQKWGEIAKVYVEEGRSGKDTNRPEFQKMVADLRSGIIDTIMVTELSRLSRSVTDFLRFMEQVNSLKADFICPQYDFDTTSPAGRVFIIILMALAQFERELTSERTRNNFHARALRGLWNGGQQILGYDIDPSNKARLVVNESEAAIVSRVFNTFLKGSSVQTTARELNATGLKNKTFRNRLGEVKGGKPFDKKSVQRILTNLTYIGKKEVQKENKNKDQSKLKETERYQVVDATWPAIISEEKFQAAQAKIKDNRQSLRVDQWKAYPFLFTNRIHCLECERGFRTSSGTGRTTKYTYYRHAEGCPAGLSRVSAEKLEQLVLDRIKNLDASEWLLKELMAAQAGFSEDKENAQRSEIKAVENEIQTISDKVATLIDRITSLPKEQDATVFFEKVREMEAQKTRLSDHLIRLKADQQSARNSKANEDELREAIRFVNGSIGELPPPLKRELVRALIQRVEFGKNRIKIYLNPRGLNAGNDGVLESRKTAPRGGVTPVANFWSIGKVGGVDGTRTRGLPRDRRTL